MQGEMGSPTMQGASPAMGDFAAGMQAGAADPIMSTIAGDLGATSSPMAGMQGLGAGGASNLALEDILKPKGLAKYDPQGIGLKLAGGALKGVAQTIIQNQNQRPGPPRELNLSQPTSQGPQFRNAAILNQLSGGGF